MKPQPAVLARQLINALAGYLAFQGYHVDANSTLSFATAALCVLITWVWSLVNKQDVTDTSRETIEKTAGALASQLLDLLPGWIGADAGTVADPVALLVFGAKSVLSHTRGSLPPSTLAQWGVKIFLFAVLCSQLVSCAGFQEHAIAYGKRAGVEAADIALQLALMQLAVTEEDLARDAGSSPQERLLKQGAVILARRAVDEARLAVAEAQANAKAKAKAPDKQPVMMSPALSEE